MLQGKHVVAVAAAKRHTVVLTSSGEVLTWGHRVVTPLRVVLAGRPKLHREPDWSVLVCPLQVSVLPSKRVHS